MLGGSQLSKGDLRSSPGSLATLTAIRRASSRVSLPVARALESCQITMKSYLAKGEKAHGRGNWNAAETEREPIPE
jgi:hypothetical protein